MIAGRGNIKQLSVETERWVSNTSFLRQVTLRYAKYLITVLKQQLLNG
jgi:hypothetical protein